MDTCCRNLQHTVSVDKHHTSLSRNSPSLLRINHLRTLWLNPSDLSRKPAIWAPSYVSAPQTEGRPFRPSSVLRFLRASASGSIARTPRPGVVSDGTFVSDTNI